MHGHRSHICSCRNRSVVAVDQFAKEVPSDDQHETTLVATQCQLTAEA